MTNPIWTWQRFEQTAPLSAATGRSRGSRAGERRWGRAAALAALILLAACGDSTRFEPIAPDATVLAFGDSVTHGTGASAGQDYPSRLAALTGWQIVNAGIPGDTAQRAVQRIGETLADARPALAIIELGGNDFLQRRGPADVKEDLRAIVQAVRSSGAVPVLVSVPELSVLRAAVGRLRDSPIYAELAAEERVLLIDDVFADVLSSPALRADPIHPNADGYHVMAERIAAALVKAGLLHGLAEEPFLDAAH